jgi:endonuclease/exonuclease/phosphatase family metal-dependent hydrolase
MGNFNAAYNPLTDRSHPPNTFRPKWQPEIDLFNFLDDWGFMDVHRHWERDNPSPTWKGFISHSRIDYIWISNDIALQHLHSFENTSIDIVTNSDHTLLKIQLYNKGLLKKKMPVDLSPLPKTDEYWISNLLLKLNGESIKKA